MGVVYKFRKEVIDFVLQQKRTDHDLGCRQLAALTSEKFKIQVSKSSVNAIIKNANLSNSVGRPVSAEPLPKKFQIPPQKKQQLLDEVRKVKAEQKPLPLKGLPPSRNAPLLEQPGRTQIGESQKRGFSSRREPFGQTTFLRHVESSRARQAQDKGIMREGMGCVFLKAAQWQLSRTSILGGLLRRHIMEPLPAQFDAFCDVLPCLKLLGVSESNQIGGLKDHALWHLNGLDQSLTDLEIARWNNIIQAIPSSVRFSLEYEKEKRQALMEAKRFELYLENGNKIIADACLTGAGDEDLSAGFLACAEQAMTMLSHCVISNNRPAIFLSSAGQRFSSSRSHRSPAGEEPNGQREPLGQTILDMVVAFEGMEGKQLKKAVVFDSAGECIAEFSLFPRKKRFFMLGVWPWQEEFLLLSENTKTIEPFYDEVTDKIFYLAAGPAPIFQGELRSKVTPLRSVAIMSSPEDAPIMVILTNCVDKAPADILQAFLRRWPNLDAGPAGKALHAVGIPAEAGSADPRSAHIQNDLPGATWPAKLDTSAIFQDWGNALNQYCQKHFLGEKLTSYDITNLISIVYSLKGYYVPQDRTLSVLLCPQTTHAHLNELQLAVQRANEAGIADPLGRTLTINILQ